MIAACGAGERDLLMPDPEAVSLADETGARHACGGKAWTVRHDGEIASAFGTEGEARAWVASTADDIIALDARLREFHEILPMAGREGTAARWILRDWGMRTVSRHADRAGAEDFLRRLSASAEAWRRELEIGDWR